MRAVFAPSDALDEPVGEAVWTGSGVEVQGRDDSVSRTLHRVFRLAPVAVDDPTLLAGSTGRVVFQPGSLQWFRAAARARSEAEGLAVRFVPEGEGAMGWDPAGSYRSFPQQIEHELERADASRAIEPEAGESRPEGAEGPSAPGTEAARPAPGPSAAGQSEGAPPPPE